MSVRERNADRKPRPTPRKKKRVCPGLYLLCLPPREAAYCLGYRHSGSKAASVGASSRVMRLAADRRQAPPVIRIRQRVPVPILHDEASIVVVFDGPGLGINLKLVCIGTGVRP